jgi:hypothetical protein
MGVGFPADVSKRGGTMYEDKKAIANRDRGRTRVKAVTTGTAVLGVVGSVGMVVAFGLGSVAPTATPTTNATTANAAALVATKSSNLSAPTTTPTAAAATATVAAPSGGS